MRVFLRASCLAVGVLSAAINAFAQNPRPGAGQAADSIPLRVQVVISRYQGEKKVSSMPFTLMVSASGTGSRSEVPSRVRMGVEVPIVGSPAPADAKANAAGSPPPPNPYRAFGTNIDCFATVLDDGRFKLGITVEESSPYTDQDRALVVSGPAPAFRSFRVSSFVVLKDGQSEQFSTATDRFSGEVVKMDMTLSVLK
jgi:hypothetical protein